VFGTTKVVGDRRAGYDRPGSSWLWDIRGAPRVGKRKMVSEEESRRGQGGTAEGGGWNRGGETGSIGEGRAIQTLVGYCFGGGIKGPEGGKGGEVEGNEREGR